LGKQIRFPNQELINMRYKMMLMALMLSVVASVMAQGNVDDKAEVSRGMKYWNKIDKEAVTTESGLQYKVLHTGRGKKPKARNNVDVHYRGILMDGRTFDTSYDSDEPIELNLGKVIKGWQEGLQLMQGGSVYLFLIPPELAYGEKGSGAIPPNATLIFEIELF
jgi:FKBP-type peptidyl-prolyl cis-trans isomerase FkpA